MGKQKEFIEYVLKLLIDNPDSMKIDIIEGEKSNLIRVQAHEDDYGRIIGRRGRSINAIRTLLAVVARDGGKRWAIDLSKEDLDTKVSKSFI